MHAQHKNVHKQERAHNTVKNNPHVQNLQYKPLIWKFYGGWQEIRIWE
jgi:hypothetical protein